VDEDPSKLCDWVAGRRERRGRGAEGTEGGPGEEVAEVWPRVALLGLTLWQSPRDTVEPRVIGFSLFLK